MSSAQPRSYPFRLCGLFACAVLVVASTGVSGAWHIAHAASPTLAPEREKRVASLVELAREHRRAGEYDKAITALREALDIHTAPWLLYSLARVYEDAGKYDLARSYYSLCLGQSVDIETRTRAEEGVARLDKIGERGRLELRIMPPDASLEIDGEPWTLDPSGAVILTAGPHQIVVSHPDYISHQQRVDVTGGQTTTIVVRLPEKAREVIVERPVVVVQERDREAVDFGPWKWLSLGFGAAATGVGIWLIADGTSDWDTVNTAIESGSMTQREANALRDEGTAKRTAGFVTAGVGGALVVTGIVMWALETGGGDGGGPSVTLTPAGGPGLTGLELNARF